MTVIVHGLSVPVHHVVEGVLALMQRDTFSGSYEDVHKAFERVRQEHPDMMSRFVFSRGENYPFSKLLEEVLTEFLHSEMIKVEGEFNPGNVTYVMPSGRKAESREFLRQRYGSEPELFAELEAMASLFEQICPERG